MTEPSQSWNRQASAKSQDAVSIRWWCPEKTCWTDTLWAGGERCIETGKMINLLFQSFGPTTRKSTAT